MPEQTVPPRLEIFGLTGIPEVKPGDPLGALIAESAERQGTPPAGWGRAGRDPEDSLEVGGQGRGPPRRDALAIRS